MIKVKALIEELKKCPAGAFAYAYQGEQDGIVVVDFEGKEVRFIVAREEWTTRFRPK